MEATLVSPYQKRIESIDLLRGLVMIIMALDHVRDYFHANSFLFDPLDLDKTNPAIYFTRWITHYCAPVFMFLAGTSASFMGRRKTKKELSLFLLTRGLWLIFLELVVVNFGWNFDILFHNIYFITIWALGVSMIALAGLIYLPRPIILAIGFIFVAGHNLLDNIHIRENTLPAFGWALLHDQAFFSWQGHNVLVGYPLLPWIGIIALGYCFGDVYAPYYTPAKRKKMLIFTGLAAIALFIVIRLVNIYGDPSQWNSQRSAFYTFLSFLNVTKYPPSLLYVLMTLGPAILFLAFTENARSAVSRVISVYGRVPMFYYLLHIYLVHLLTIFAAALFTNFNWKLWLLEEPLWFTKTLKGYGFSLGVVYLVWIGIVIALFPLCKWYDRYKQSHKEKWWLSYL
ncbi:MAG: heparan-alpha-glucosaminide N-acetyltransferase domain-containing protein [Bacteroidota bacterium]